MLLSRCAYTAVTARRKWCRDTLTLHKWSDANIHPFFYPPKLLKIFFMSPEEFLQTVQNHSEKIASAFERKIPLKVGRVAPLPVASITTPVRMPNSSTKSTLTSLTTAPLALSKQQTSVPFSTRLLIKRTATIAH